MNSKGWEKKAGKPSTPSGSATLFGEARLLADHYHDCFGALRTRTRNGGMRPGFLKVSFAPIFCRKSLLLSPFGRFVACRSGKTPAANPDSGKNLGPGMGFYGCRLLCGTPDFFNNIRQERLLGGKF
jgi:hypothetical protein